MASLTIENVSNSAVSIRELYIDIQPGQSHTIDRPQWSLSSLTSLHELMLSGSVTATVAYTAAENNAVAEGLIFGIGGGVGPQGPQGPPGPTGPAGPAGSAVPSSGFQSSATTDFYRASAAGVCPGSNDFLVVALAVPFTERDGSKIHTIADNSSGSTGWRITWGYGLILANVFDSLGGLVAVSVPSSVFDPGSHAGDLLCVALRVRQVLGVTQASVWVGPAQRAVANGTDPGVAPSTAGLLAVGFADLFGEGTSLDGGVLGLGYYNGTITDDVLRVLMGRCGHDGELPTDVITWTTAWLGSALSTAPATAVASVGTGTLNRQGSPTPISGFFP